MNIFTTWKKDRKVAEAPIPRGRVETLVASGAGIAPRHNYRSREHALESLLGLIREAGNETRWRSGWKPTRRDRNHGRADGMAGKGNIAGSFHEPLTSPRQPPTTSHCYIRFGGPEDHSKADLSIGAGGRDAGEWHRSPSVDRWLQCQATSGIPRGIERRPTPRPSVLDRRGFPGQGPIVTIGALGAEELRHALLNDLTVAKLDEALEAGVLIHREELKYDPDDVKISLIYQLYHSGRAVLHPGYDGADVDLPSPPGNARDLGGDWSLAWPGESDIGSELDLDVELDQRAGTPSEGHLRQYGVPELPSYPSTNSTR